MNFSFEPNRSISLWLIFYLAAVCSVAGCSNQDAGLQSGGSGTMSGKVSDGSGNGLSGVSLETVPATSTQTTDVNGSYSFTNITAQAYTVTAKKSGFVKASAAVTVENGKTATANISISAGPSYTGAVQPIFNANCTSAGCHASSGSAGSYNLTTFAGATAKDVTAFDADGSLLFKRISGSSAGSQMPSGASALSASDQQKIKDWINSGVPNN